MNLPGLFNLSTDKTIHVIFVKNCEIDLKKNNLYKEYFLPAETLTCLE